MLLLHDNFFYLQEKGIFHKNNSRYALQQKSLVSKFLYHSLAVAEPKSSDRVTQNNHEATPVSMPVATVSYQQ